MELVHLHTEGAAPYAAPDLGGSFHTSALFVGANPRAAVASGEADYIPMFLSEVPALFKSGRIPLDAALIQVSPPDRHGRSTPGCRGPTATGWCTWTGSTSPSRSTTSFPSGRPRRWARWSAGSAATSRASSRTAPPCSSASAPYLGIHSEMFSDGVVELVERGVITGALERTHPGKVVGSFILGTRRVYDFVDDNPEIAMLEVDYANDSTA